MENVKYMYSEKKRGQRCLYFKICDKFADFIRRNTKYSKEDLNRFYLDENNLFEYSISLYANPNNLRTFIDNIERISNEGDEENIYNHILTHEGRRRIPSDIHRLMHEEYGLVDITKEDYPREEADLEWWTAHFFIRLSVLIFDRPLYEEDSEYEEIIETSSFSEVSDILSMFKSIDHIVVVDDARRNYYADTNGY